MPTLSFNEMVVMVNSKGKKEGSKMKEEKKRGDRTRRQKERRGDRLKKIGKKETEKRELG